ncbi:hypothetical protein Q1695_001204 [Nippostrongylus brasiliensis]|nr:hypothetical protein Q1695_001204 [Nippostrongylus brasiliensis]
MSTFCIHRKDIPCKVHDNITTLHVTTHPIACCRDVDDSSPAGRILRGIGHERDDEQKAQGRLYTHPMGCTTIITVIYDG